MTNQEQESSHQEVDQFLATDSFQNEQSRRLFEAIDELRSCGANHEIDLPEVGRIHATSIFSQGQSLT
jgi:hypothetical protein